jgi:hypothetical protein
VGATGAHSWGFYVSKPVRTKAATSSGSLGAKNNGMPHVAGIVLHIIALRFIFCMASAWGSSPSHISTGNYDYGSNVSIAGLAGCMAWSGIALQAELAFNHPL